MKDALPREFLFSHDLCFFLHDQLVETLKSGEAAKIFEITVNLSDPKEAEEVTGFSGEDFLCWLEKTNRKADVYDLYYRNVTAALLSDFLHFIYEALQCSRKGKLTVCYALLRKPLKDNLFYLEWLLSDSVNFLKRFESSDSQRFALPEPHAKSRQIEIIRKAMAKTRAGEWLDAELIYDLRYNKNSTYGMEPLWQQANHLFTSFRTMKTEECNFNFVFSNPDDTYSQWRCLYAFLPILLYHAVQIVEAILANFAKRQDAENDIMPIRTDAGILLWLARGPWAEKGIGQSSSIGKFFGAAPSECPTCSRRLSQGVRNLELFYRYGALRCGKCRTVVTIT